MAATDMCSASSQQRYASNVRNSCHVTYGSGQNIGYTNSYLRPQAVLICFTNSQRQFLANSSGIHTASICASTRNGSPISSFRGGMRAIPSCLAYGSKSRSTRSLADLTGAISLDPIYITTICASHVKSNSSVCSRSKLSSHKGLFTLRTKETDKDA